MLGLVWKQLPRSLSTAFPFWLEFRRSIFQLFLHFFPVLSFLLIIYLDFSVEYFALDLLWIFPLHFGIGLIYVKVTVCLIMLTLVWRRPRAGTSLGVLVLYSTPRCCTLRPLGNGVLVVLVTAELTCPFVGSFMAFTIVSSTATKKDQLLRKDKHDWTGRRGIQPIMK